MPKFDATNPRKPVRILLVGDPGGGKSTAYLHLLAHGYKLHVADFDNGLKDALAAVPLTPDQAQGLVYETFVDKTRPNAVNGFPQPVGKPAAWRKFVKYTDKWVDSADGTDYGVLEQWGMDRCFVLDNVTSMGNSIAYAVQEERGALGKKMHPSAVHETQLRIEGLFQSCLSFNCDVIMLAHLQAKAAAEDMNLDDKNGDRDLQELKAEAKAANPNTSVRHPYTVGKALSPRVGAYFTAVLHVKQVGEGRSMRPVISTVSAPDVTVKFAPRGLPAEFAINELHKIIEALR